MLKNAELKISGVTNAVSFVVSFRFRGLELPAGRERSQRRARTVRANEITTSVWAWAVPNGIVVSQGLGI